MLHLRTHLQHNLLAKKAHLFAHEPAPVNMYCSCARRLRALAGVMETGSVMVNSMPSMWMWSCRLSPTGRSATTGTCTHTHIHVHRRSCHMPVSCCLNQLVSKMNIAFSFRTQLFGENINQHNGKELVFIYRQLADYVCVTETKLRRSQFRYALYTIRNSDI